MVAVPDCKEGLVLTWFWCFLFVHAQYEATLFPQQVTWLYDTVSHAKQKPSLVCKWQIAAGAYD